MTTTEPRLMATDCYAVPGSDSIVDMIHPVTGLTICYHETLEQIQVTYPGAERVNFETWCAAKGAKQDSPLTWQTITEEQYDYALEVLPPAGWRGDSFLLGEPQDHHAGSGQPRYSMFRKIGDQYQESSRPVTIQEFLALTTKGGQES